MSHPRLTPDSLALQWPLPAAFLIAVYIRFYSGLLPIIDRPWWPAYLAYFTLSAGVWHMLGRRAGIIARCCSEPSLARWAWGLAQVDLLALALVSAAAFFWRGYSFSRWTVMLFWTLHLALSVAAAGALRRRRAARASQSEGWGAQAVDYVLSKRLIDVVVSAAGLVLLALPAAAIALVIWRRSGRPVVLGQLRVGRGGRRFRLYKFRSLPVHSLADGDRRWKPAPTADAWSRLLRSTGLDELPQLWNVLKGEMSLVGPRPERPHFVEQFRRQLPFYSTRHRFEVGITGWAQVNGWRGDTSIDRRVEHDLYYLRHWSLALDFRILWMTAVDFARRLREAADARFV